MLQWVCFYIHLLSTWTWPGLDRCACTVFRHHLSSLQDMQSHQYSPKPERVSPAWCVYNQLKPSTVLCHGCYWPKLMGFWLAPGASGAEAQHSVFAHVEISHLETLKCVLPTETNNFLFIPQFLLSVLWFVLSLLFLTFLRFKLATLGTVLGAISDYHPATRSLLYRRTDFLLLFSFYLHYSLSSWIFSLQPLPLTFPYSYLFQNIFSAFSTCLFLKFLHICHLWSYWIGLAAAPFLSFLSLLKDMS